MQTGSHTIELQNQDKIFSPDEKITKGDLIDYYSQVSGYLLPFLKDRPLTLRRFPDGINGDGFYQKEVPDYFPDWIKVTEVKKKEGGTTPQVICNNKATLIYLVNQGTLSFHPWLSTADNISNPNKLVFDLDPPEDDFDLVIKGAKALKQLLEEKLDLNTFVMTTGSEGLHVISPIKPTHDFEAVHTFAKKTANLLKKQNADDFTTEMRKEDRNGRLFIDYLRNSYAQTSISPYSARALKGAPVATPLNWDELATKGLTSKSYHIKNIFKRLSQKEDLWTQFSNKAVDIESRKEQLDNLITA